MNRRRKRTGRIARLRERRKKLAGKIILVAAGILVLAALLVIVLCPVKSITFSGNVHYTEEELEKLVFKNKACYNSLYLLLEYRNGKKVDIPFVEELEVELKSLNEVKINVYEKGIVGYMEVLDSYVYFDKDGVVVEISGTCFDDVLQVSGLSQDSVSLNKKLPIEDDGIFKVLLNLTQLLEKNEIHPDKLHFSENGEMTLYFGEAKVFLGRDVNTDEKIIRLKSIVPKLEGRKGTLHMENVDEKTENLTFENE